MPRVRLTVVEAPAPRRDFARWAGWVPSRVRTEHAVNLAVAHSRVDTRTRPPRIVPCDCDLCRHVARLPVG